MFERLTRAIRQNPAASALFATLLTYAAYAWAADTQIDALTDGDPAQAADQIPINRPADTDRRITAGTIRYLKDTMVNATSVSWTPSADCDDCAPTNWDGTEPSKATMILAAPTVSMIMGGLTGGNGNDARLATICNVLDPTASTSRLMILEHEQAAATAANRFSFNDRFARFLAAGDCVSMFYDDTADRWRNITPVNFRASFDVANDFGGQGVGVTTGSMGENFACDQTGTATTCDGRSFLAGNGAANPIGVVGPDTGTTATGRAYVQPNGNVSRAWVVPLEGHLLFMARVGVSTLSTGTERYQVYCGFHDAGAGTSATNGYYWLYDEATSTGWRKAIEDAGVQTVATVTGFTVATTGYDWIGIYVYGNGSNADFFHSSDGVSWTMDGNLTTPDTPEAADTMTVSCGINKTIGTTSREMNIDFMGYRIGALMGG